MCYSVALGTNAHAWPPPEGKTEDQREGDSPYQEQDSNQHHFCYRIPHAHDLRDAGAILLCRKALWKGARTASVAAATRSQFPAAASRNAARLQS